MVAWLVATVRYIATITPKKTKIYELVRFTAVMTMNVSTAIVIVPGISPLLLGTSRLSIHSEAVCYCALCYWLGVIQLEFSWFKLSHSVNKVR